MKASIETYLMPLMSVRREGGAYLFDDIDSASWKFFDKQKKPPTPGKKNSYLRILSRMSTQLYFQVMLYWIMRLGNLVNSSLG